MPPFGWSHFPSQRDRVVGAPWLAPLPPRKKRSTDSILQNQPRRTSAVSKGGGGGGGEGVPKGPREVTGLEGRGHLPRVRAGLGLILIPNPDSDPKANWVTAYLAFTCFHHGHVWDGPPFTKIFCQAPSMPMVPGIGALFPTPQSWGAPTPPPPPPDVEIPTSLEQFAGRWLRAFRIRETFATQLFPAEPLPCPIHTQGQCSRGCRPTRSDLQHPSYPAQTLSRQFAPVLFAAANASHSSLLTDPSLPVSEASFLLRTHKSRAAFCALPGCCCTTLTPRSNGAMLQQVSRKRPLTDSTGYD